MADNPESKKLTRSQTAFKSARAEVQKLIKEALSDIARAEYSGAVRKMEVCAMMVETENSQCIALRDQANRLQQAMLRCVAGGNEWVGHQCP